MFKRHGEYVANDRQMEEFAKQELRRKQASDAGRSSAAKRAEEAKAIIAQHLDSPTPVERPLNDRCDFVQRKSNPPIPTPSSSPVSVSVRQRSASKPALSGFDEFWQAYPRKTGKGAAEASWAKVPKSAHPAIMEAIQKQRNGADWQKDGGRFIPHPATWLNQRRWEDEVTVFSAPSPGHTIITPRPTAGPGSEPIKPLKEIAEDDLPAVPLRALVNQLRGGA